MIPKIPKHPKITKRKINKAADVKLPKISKNLIPKSLSPSPISVRQQTSICSPRTPNLDSYYEEFDRITTKNILVRKNWLLAKEKLINIELSMKLNQIPQGNLSNENSSQIFKF